MAQIQVDTKASVGDSVSFRQVGSRKIYTGTVEAITIRIGVYKPGEVAPAHVGKQFTAVHYTVNIGPRDQYSTKDRIKIISEGYILP